MQEIANRAPIPEAELVDAVMDGLNDKSTNIAMLYGATYMTELKMLLERYEKKCGRVNEGECGPQATTD